ncbi:helix-turn-helix domain-containing protein [Franconibacter helveticus]|uniref:helix-turn-helix domain-containing protein n=1 Tax=Franconibacter helveticus TaxID=357240 RepID=UPI00066AF2DE|nr:helix-turn-helix domain-containing protein [Franconibacter helveticus]
MNKTASPSSFIQLKPLAEIEAILDKVSPFAEPFIATRGEVLQYNISGKHQSYLLHSGSITLNRRGDGMILKKESAPFILGVSNQYSSNGSLYVKAIENSQLSRLSAERFNLLIGSYNLWQELSYLLIYNASSMYAHSAMNSQMSSYDLIRFQLNELMNEPDNIRQSTTAANYILNRTYLSRSSVMRIIASLRNEGYITLQRGVLVHLANLPESFR